MYNLGDPPMILTLPAFSNDKGIVGDPKLDIIYSLVKGDGSALTASDIISNFDPATLAITIQTNDDTLPRTNPMKLIGHFSYRPSFKVEVPFNVILEKCFKTTISLSPLTPIIYQVGMPLIQATVPPFTNKYGAECEPFIYSVSMTPSAAVLYDPVNLKLNI